MTPAAWAATASTATSGVGVGGHDEPVARDEQCGHDARVHAVRREARGQDVGGGVAHRRSRAVPRSAPTASANASADA